MKTDFKVLMTLMDLKIGGAQTHVLELSEGLAKLGVNVIVASKGGVYVKELEEHGIKHIEVPMHNKNIFNLIYSYFKLKKIIEENDIRLVHAHARIPAFICGLLKRFMNFRYVTTAHWVFSTALPFRMLSNWGEQALTVSEDIKQYLIDNYNYPSDNISVTINGIDLDKFSINTDASQILKEFKLDQTKKRILCISRLDKDRSLPAHKLIEAAEQLFSLNKKLEIIIVGNGNDYDEIRKKAEEVNNKVGKKLIILTGARTDINALVASSYVVVAVSRSALEAMAAEKPVIMAGNEGYVGIFDETKLDISIETNFCFRGCQMITTEELLNDLIKVFRMDKEQIEKLGAFGRKVILERYSVDKMAHDALRVYERVLKPNREIDIMISGFYGFNNQGDEAVLKSIVSDLREIKPDLRIVVLSKRPIETALKHNVEAVGRLKYLQILKLMKKTKLLISGGGSLIQDVTSSRSLWYYIIIINLAIRKHTRVMFYSNGIGPIIKESNKKLAAKVMNKVDQITLRDFDSAETLSGMGVVPNNLVVTADPVFSIVNSDLTEVDVLLEKLELKNKKYFCVSIRSWKHLSQDFSKTIIDFCEYVNAKYGYVALFIPMQPDHDSSISKSLVAGIKKGALFAGDKLSINELLGLVARSEFVLGMRLHAAIYALKYGVPIIGLVYDPKVEATLKQFEQNYYVNVENIDLESLKKFADYCILNKSIIEEKLFTLSAEAVKKSKLSAQIAIELMDKDCF